MLFVSKKYLAEEETQKEINNKIGTNADTESQMPTTLFSGIKQFLKNLTETRAAKIDSNAEKLSNSVYGLQAIKNEVTAAKNAAGGSVIKSVQRGIVTITGGTASAKITAVNISKSVVIFGGASLAADSGHYGNVSAAMQLCRLWLENSTTVKAEREYIADENLYIPWQVIEFY